MKRLLIALMLLALAAPAWATEDIIFYGQLQPKLQEDGTTTQEMQLADGTILPKSQQHPGYMVQIGEVPDKGKIYQWLDTSERADKLKTNKAYLGAKIEDLPGEAQDYVLEVEVPSVDGDGKPIIRRMKVAEAKALGMDTDKLKAEKPHKWQGR